MTCSVYHRLDQLSRFRALTDVESRMLERAVRDHQAETLKQRVAAFYGVSVDDMISPSRLRRLVRPRQVGMYLAKRIHGFSALGIAATFGRTDHTTAIHAVKAVEARRATDPDLDHDIRTLTLLLAPAGSGQLKAQGDN